MSVSPGLIQAALGFIIGGGLLVGVTQVVRSWATLRSGARANVRDVIRDIAASRDEAEDREAAMRLDKDYWRDVAGGYGFQLRNHGLTPDPAIPRSPSERARDRRNTSRARRAGRAPTTAEIRAVIDDEGTDDDR